MGGFRECGHVFCMVPLGVRTERLFLVRHIDHPVPAWWCLTTCMFANKNPRLSTPVGYGVSQKYIK